MIYPVYTIIIIFIILIGLPVSIGIGMVGFGGVISVLGYKFFETSSQVMVDGLGHFVLIAAPFFMLAGQVMNTGGMTRRIFRFANALVGRLPGGLGQVNILASMLFSGMTGAAISDAVGLGTMEIEAMKENGYDLKLSAAITAASSTIGPIVPPSVPMVIFGALSGASIGSLFIAGIVPGVLMGGALMITVYIYALLGKCGAKAVLPKNELWLSAKDAIPSLINPIIVVGGIFTGIFTPTEAAIVASAYAILITFLYKELTFSKLFHIIINVASSTGALFLIVAATTLLGWVVARSGIMVDVALFMTDIVSGKISILLIITVLFLIIGCVMEPIAALILLVPILMPIVKTFQIDLVHFGIITVLSLVLGLLTPPVGLILYAVAGIAKIRFDEMVKATLPFLIPLFIVLFLIVIFPDIVLFLPKFFYKLKFGI